MTAKRHCPITIPLRLGTLIGQELYSFHNIWLGEYRGSSSYVYITVLYDWWLHNEQLVWIPVDFFPDSTTRIYLFTCETDSCVGHVNTSTKKKTAQNYGCEGMNTVMYQNPNDSGAFSIVPNRQVMVQLRRPDLNEMYKLCFGCHGSLFLRFQLTIFEHGFI